MNKAIKITTCVATAIALSGCQSFVSKLGFGPKEPSMRAEAGAPVFGSEELEKGRAALKAGYPGNAITQFRLAAMNRETAPDAFNGMGVAYAKLGRADLAERYFKMAVTLDGTNPRYAANLARFYDSPLGTSSRALAMREKEAQATLAAAAKAAEAQGLIAPQEAADERRGDVTLVRAPVTVSRTSSREMRIATRSDASRSAEASMPEVAVRRPARPQVEAEAETVTEASAPIASPTRVSMINNLASSESYPVRIKIVKPDSTGSTSPRSRQYPVRIALQARHISE